MDELEDKLDERIKLARQRTTLSIDRNRMANVRTFLAWTRTGLASVAGGLAIVRFLPFAHLTHEILGKVMGAALVVLGIIIFSLSLYDYYTTYRKHPAPEGYAGSLAVVTLISFVLIIVSGVMLLISLKWIF